MVRSFQKASLQGSLPPPMGSVHGAVVMGHSLSCPGTCPQLPAVPCALVLLHTFSNLLVHRANVTKPTLPKTPSAVKSTWLSCWWGTNRRLQKNSLVGVECSRE